MRMIVSTDIIILCFFCVNVVVESTPTSLPSLVPTVSPCVDDDNAVFNSSGYTCSQLSALGQCSSQFCPTCTYAGYCDVSCDYCPTPAPTVTPTVYVCTDDDAAVYNFSGYTCSQLYTFGQCSANFCPSCPYAGYCDVSCGYCPTSSPTLAPTPLPTEIRCTDHDDTIKNATGYNCSESAILGLCDANFCPTCEYAGMCQISCGYCSPTLLPTAIPTSTPLPTTWDSSCDDRLEYVVVDTTGYPCSYYAALGDTVCGTYFCDTCQFPLHYCSESCGYCVENPSISPTTSPTLLPSLSVQPTISIIPTALPSPAPSAIPTITSAPTQLPSQVPSVNPTNTMSPTSVYYPVTTYEELKEAFNNVRDFLLIEIFEDIFVNDTLTIDTYGEFDDEFAFRNITIFSKTRCKLYGNNKPIFYFWGIDGLTIENLIFLNGVGNLQESGAITIHLSNHVLLKDLLLTKNNAGPVVTPVGGSLSVYNSPNVYCHNVTFSENVAYSGGAMAVANTQYSTQESEIFIIDCVFEKNEANLATDGSGAGGFGGAILVSVGSFLTIIRTSFISNEAQFLALDIYILSGTVIGEDLIFSAKSDPSKAHIGRDDGTTLQCGPSCSTGQYGNCSLNILDLCYANCHATCTDCPSGTANNQIQSAGLESCIACAPGFVSDVGASSCDICPTGKYATNGSTIVNGLSLAGASLCEECSAGYYQPVEGGLRCLFCESGSSSSAGADDCVECEAGQFAQSGSSSCIDCDPGTFAPSPGSDSCSACASFEFSRSGATSCDLALEGYYFPPTSTAITECPSNSYCAGGYDLPKPDSGYWVERRSSKYATTMQRCSRSTCKGGEDDEIVNGTSCWSVLYFNKTWLDSVSDGTVCDSDQLQCRSGSYGPLCGACDSGYIYSSTDSTCITCDRAWTGASIVISCGFVLVVVAVIIWKYKDRVMSMIGRWWIVGIIRQLDSGSFRVIWGTYQIIESISWSIDVVFPYPYSKLMSGLSIFSFDFIPLACLFKNSNHFSYVYIWSVGPILLILLIFMSYLIRNRNLRSDDVEHYTLVRQHSYAALLLSFVMLPPVSRVQFQALDCLSIANRLYLRVDTSISCETDSFQQFALIDGLFIIIYLSIPLVWICLLYRVRDHLNPKIKSRRSVQVRQLENDHELQPLKFLFDVYKPEYYYFEAVEMFRRIFFVGLIPLLSSISSRRASFGLFASLCSLAVYREVEPFLRSSTNVLVHVAQIVIFLTFGSALVIDTGVSDSINKVVFGITLVVLNLIIVTLAIAMGAARHAREEREKWSWQHVMNTQELAIVAQLLPESLTTASTESSSTSSSSSVNSRSNLLDSSNSVLSSNSSVLSSDGEQDDPVRAKAKREARQNQMLKQYILKPKDVSLEKRVGAGAFGEVFMGKCVGQPVAIKTMIDVTEANVKDFKREILLTATLRHPNIVNFVGACWSRELMCLVLEWVPNGSLGSMLENPKLDLYWSDPLLRLAIDLARGMSYLHGRSYYDEEEEKQQNCIIHRDLKPDNALVTEFSSAKLTDFGTSRAKEEDDATMTAVGTPLFCAPEIMRGELYNEKADVYSFGMTLIDMCTDEPILSFVGERWRIANNKKQVPKQPMRFIRSITEEGWRPVINTDGTGSIEQAPASINNLIIQCCQHEANQRPSFDDIIDILLGPVSSEVQLGKHTRKPHRDGSQPMLDIFNMGGDTVPSPNEVREKGNLAAKMQEKQSQEYANRSFSDLEAISTGHIRGFGGKSSRENQDQDQDQDAGFEHITSIELTSSKSVTSSTTSI